MTIPTITTFHYVLRDKDGNEIDNSSEKDPIAVMVGKGHVVKGLDDLLPSLEKGEKKSVIIQPQDGYGVVDESLRMKVPRSQFPPDVDLQVKMQFQTSPAPDAPIFTVMHIDEEDMIYLDGNHPLAGHELHFDLEIVDKRPASPEEIAHGHAHGPGGHHH